IHFLSSALLFIVFAIFSLFLFTKTNKPVKSVGKKQRNLVFIICGLVIIAVLLIIALIFILLPKEQIASSTLIFWLESIALWAFGVSWLVKGRFLS
ncbi:MAG TPA: hypothetical protein PLV65_07140, partial [Tenuifilaceae bacterium]|nr:hypothetical protein [Tenuifilaceae bacterium]